GIRDATVTGVQTCALPIWGGAVQVLQHVDNGQHVLAARTQDTHGVLVALRPDRVGGPAVAEEPAMVLLGDGSGGEGAPDRVGGDQKVHSMRDELLVAGPHNRRGGRASVRDAMLQ